MEKVIKEETAKIKKAFEEWAERNGFKVIRCQYDMKLGTCRLFRRRGKFYIEVGSELTKAQDAIIKRAVAGFNRFRVSAMCVPSIFETKWTLSPTLA